MALYYVNNNAQPNGDHEVHREGCNYMPNNRTNLGNHLSCHSAVAQARRTYRTANGCRYCATECHTS
jgi:hypothetical protein